MDILKNLNIKTYFDDKEPLESKRALKSLRSIYTYFNNREHLRKYKDEILPNIEYEDLNNSHFKVIEQNISKSILSYLNNGKNKEEDLISIFHAIQFWGGGEGRWIYARDGGFAGNFKIEEYETMIYKLKQYKSKTIKLDELVDFISNNQIRIFGISFATKHIRFWSEHVLGKKDALPIFDRLISQQLYNIEKPNEKLLLNYYNEMKSLALEKKSSMLDLESVLFDIIDRNPQ